MLVIKGLKKVAGETKRIDVCEKGVVIYDKATKSVTFDGIWSIAVQFCKSEPLDDSKICFTVYKPMTMREIKKMIAKEVDCDTYIKMNLEDEGHAKINGKWVYVG